MPKPCSFETPPPPAPEAPSPADWTGRPGAAGRGWPSEHAIGLICRAVPPARRARETALDVGCGNGRNSVALAELGFGRVVAVDVNAELVAAARRAAAMAAVAIEVRRAPVAALPLNESDADLALCWGLLFALGGAEPTRAALGEIARVLRPGGVLVADWRTPEDDLHRGDAEPVAEDTWRLPADAPAGLGGVVYSFWRREQVESMLNQAGFSLVALQRYELRDCLRGPTFSWWQTCARRFAN